jgi:hypothetical protein
MNKKTDERVIARMDKPKTGTTKRADILTVK